MPIDRNEILRIGSLQVRALLDKMMRGDDALDDREVVPIIATLAKATQEACNEIEGLDQALLEEAFEVFNAFCIAADPDNTRSDNLKYFQKLLPKPPKVRQRKK